MLQNIYMYVQCTVGADCVNGGAGSKVIYNYVINIMSEVLLSHNIMLFVTSFMYTQMSLNGMWLTDLIKPHGLTFLVLLFNFIKNVYNLFILFRSIPEYYSSADISGWFWLTSKSHEMFGIIVYTQF